MLRLASVDRIAAAMLLSRYGLDLALVSPNEQIPGSYWGDSEASHYICMSPERRAGLDRDAGGDDLEESAVCYLQILLADEIPGVGRARLCADMDDWGYSFRLGSSRLWFESDADDARIWLQEHGVIDRNGSITWFLRS